MVADGYLEKQRKNPNDPVRFVNRIGVTEGGERAKVHYFIDMVKITEEQNMTISIPSAQNC